MNRQRANYDVEFILIRLLLRTLKVDHFVYTKLLEVEWTDCDRQFDF